MACLRGQRRSDADGAPLGGRLEGLPREGKICVSLLVAFAGTRSWPLSPDLTSAMSSALDRRGVRRYAMRPLRRQRWHTWPASRCHLRFGRGMVPFGLTDSELFGEYVLDAIEPG